MTTELLMQQAALLTISAELGLMDSANQQRLIRGESPAYTEDHYQNLLNRIKEIECWIRPASDR
jgi:intein-encoded DNA endonuclease-like protein